MRKKLLSIQFILWVVPFSFLFFGLPANAGEPGDCLTCHDDKVNQKQYLNSVHGNLSCTSCHISVTDQHPEDSPGKVDCAICHQEEVKAYQNSVHMSVHEADPESAPDCTTCHGTHSMMKSEKKEFKKSMLDLCGKCHPTASRTFYDTYHGKVANLGYPDSMPLCWDCHKAHEILSPQDPSSPVSTQNVLSTCQTCHPGATVKFARYRVHGDKFNKKGDPISFWTYVVMFAIVCFAFGTWVPHTILWFIRDFLESRKEKSKSSSGEKPEQEGS